MTADDSDPQQQYRYKWRYDPNFVSQVRDFARLQMAGKDVKGSKKRLEGKVKALYTDGTFDESEDPESVVRWLYGFVTDKAPRTPQFENLERIAIIFGYDSLLDFLDAVSRRQSAPMPTTTAAKAAADSTPSVQEPLPLQSEPSLPQGSKRAIRYEQLTPLLRDLNYWCYHDALDVEVPAVQLPGFGAGTDFVGINDFRITYQHIPFVAAPDMAAEAQAAAITAAQEAQKRGVDYYNGPNVRLIEFSRGFSDAKEAPVLNVTLGPVSWDDYVGNLAVLHGRLPDQWELVAYDYFTSITSICERREFSKNRLPNIASNALTIITTDCQIGYTRRGNFVSSPGGYTSAVAEGTNRFLDDIVMSASGLELANPLGTFDRTTAPRDATYKPSGIPHPFFAACRGIEEELSPGLLKHVNNSTLKLIGIAFDLIHAHPDFLFLAAMPLSSQQILDICERDRGTYWYEGRLKFEPIDLKTRKTPQVLQDRTWIPGGLASVIRSLQLLRALTRAKRAPYEDIHAFLQH